MVDQYSLNTNDESNSLQHQQRDVKVRKITQNAANKSVTNKLEV